MLILRKFKITWKRLVVLAVIVLVIGGILLSRSKNKAEVASIKVERGTVKEELILSGSVKAEMHSLLRFPASGKISWVGVTEGDQVKKGQALISLDRTTLLAAYNQALNNYRNYQAAADQTLDSVQGHTGNETYSQRADRTQAEVNRDNAYDALKAAQYNLSNATLFAPFNGFVSSIPFTSPGVHISLTDMVIEIVDPSTIYFEVEADQNDVGKLTQGMDVIIVADALEGREFKGQVVFISLTPKTGQVETTYRVKAIINEDKDIRVGMTGDAKFLMSQKENVLFVPTRFINTDKEGKFVNLGKPGNKVYVEVGVEGEETTEIVNGVSEGDTLYD